MAVLSSIALAAWLVPAGTEALRDGEGGDEAGTPSILRIEAGGLLYTYHLLTRTEALFDLGADPRCLENLALVRPEDARRMRDRLTREVGVDDLEGLSREYEPVVLRMRGLGYF